MTASAAPTGPSYDHLRRLTGGRGLYEHALFTDPRTEHGFCTDDVARALVVTCRETPATSALRPLSGQYLDFTVAAVQPDGSCHNRMTSEGQWSDEPGVGDWWGRALWGLGTAAVRAPTDAGRARALLAFRCAAQQRSPHLRSMVFAGLGAGELLLHRPQEQSARALLHDASAMLRGCAGTRGWSWPEPRLTYANAALAECLLLAGDTLDDARTTARGFELLEFLLDLETREGHLSVTPVAGRGPADRGPGFDQQAIEVATLADACHRARSMSTDPRWLRGIELAWGWFAGDNDAGVLMYDPATGGGYDGLQQAGRNQNQGAESTLAVLSTAQHARRHGVLT